MPELAYIIAGSRSSVRVEFASDPETPNGKPPLQVLIYYLLKTRMKFISFIVSLHNMSLIFANCSCIGIGSSRGEKQQSLWRCYIRCTSKPRGRMEITTEVYNRYICTGIRYDLIASNISIAMDLINTFFITL